MESLWAKAEDGEEVPEEEDELPEGVEREEEIAVATPILVGEVATADGFDSLFLGGVAKGFAGSDDDWGVAEGF